MQTNKQIKNIQQAFSGLLRVVYDYGYIHKLFPVGPWASLRSAS